MTTVWFKPTLHSPACEFVVNDKLQKRLSTCGMWTTVTYRGVNATERPPKDACVLCREGKRATGNLGDTQKRKA